MTAQIHFKEDHLDSYTDAHLANLWAAMQATCPPFGDRETCLAVERLGREIIRRWLVAQPPSLWGHQSAHYYVRQLQKADGKWKDGEWHPTAPAQEAAG